MYRYVYFLYIYDNVWNIFCYFKNISYFIIFFYFFVFFFASSFIIVKEIKKRGHSTPAMAGDLAKKMNAQVLLLNHISNMYTTEEDVLKIMESAKNTNHDTSHILVAYDFMEFILSRDGFK